MSDTIDFPLISVIIPIYNAEKYISRCMDSIMKQTYRNLEIIAVNDGSTDKSLELLKAYQERDKRVIVLTGKNGGVSAARNKGMSIAKGEYISFIDADDFIHENYYTYLFGLCRKYSADYAECKCETGDGEVFTNLQKGITEEVTNFRSMMSANGRKVSNSVCGAICRRKIIEKERFPLGTRYEDEYFAFKMYYFANKVVLSNAQYYYYFMHADSFMNSQTEPVAWQMVNAYKYKIKYFHDLKEYDFEDISRKEMCIRLIPMYFAAYRQNDKDAMKEIKKMYFEYYKSISNWKVLPKSERPIIALFHTCPGLMAFLETKVNLRRSLKRKRERK